MEYAAVDVSAVLAMNITRQERMEFKLCIGQEMISFVDANDCACRMRWFRGRLPEQRLANAIDLLVPPRKRGVRPIDPLEASKQRSFSSSRTAGRVITEIVFKSQSRYLGRFVFYFSVFTCREYIEFG
jgi:hypothetical protein